MNVLLLNHIAIHVTDVHVSAAFYSQTLRLEPLARPAFDFPGAWFRLGPDQELHLIGERVQEVHSDSRGNHFALTIDDVDAWEQHLAQLGTPRKAIQTRPDGAKQLFLQDPDGHWIELCMPPQSV